MQLRGETKWGIFSILPPENILFNKNKTKKKIDKKKFIMNDKLCTSVQMVHENYTFF